MTNKSKAPETLPELNKRVLFYTASHCIDHNVASHNYFPRCHVV